MPRNVIISIIVVLVLMSFGFLAQADPEAQRGSPVTAECGNIIDSAFSTNYQEQTFVITMSADDSIDLSVMPHGGQLSTGILVTGPTNLGVGINKGSVYADQYSSNGLESQPKINTGGLSADGQYTVRIVNFDFYQYFFTKDTYYGLSNSGGIGKYTLYIGCTLADGTVVHPGDKMPALQPTAAPTSLPIAFAGFPGLAPVDFSNVAKIPMIAGSPMAGAITPTGGEIIGFTFDGNTGKGVDLTFNRVAPGNLNLGLVVLSPDNKVVFQASLVTSDSLSTHFTLPSDGTYTIGVFRVDLLPPDNPQATAFQVQATVSS